MANEKQKGTLSLAQLIGYGACSMGTLTFTASWVAYMVLPFLTNIAGFSTTAAAGIYSLSNIIKVLATIAGGSIIDSVNWKKGKFRTWTLVGGIAILAFSCMFFKFDLPEKVYVIVFTVLFFMNQFAYQCAWVGARSLVIKFSKNNQDNVNLATAAQLGSMGAGVIFGLIYVKLYMGPLGKYGTDFFLPTVLYSVIALIGCVVLFMMAKNYDLPAEANPNAPKAQKVTLKDMLSSLKGQGLVYFIAGTFGNIQSGFFSTLLFYFTTYVLKNPEIAGLAVTINSVGGFLGALTTPWVVKQQVGISVVSLHLRRTLSPRMALRKEPHRIPRSTCSPRRSRILGRSYTPRTCKRPCRLQRDEGYLFCKGIRSVSHGSYHQNRNGYLRGYLLLRSCCNRI